MDFWTITLIVGGVYVALCVADKVLQKYKEKKAVSADVGTAGAGVTDTGANHE